MLKFDNSYSRFTSKQLLYMYEMTKRDAENDVEISVSDLGTTSPMGDPLSPCNRLDTLDEDDAQ